MTQLNETQLSAHREASVFSEADYLLAGAWLIILVLDVAGIAHDRRPPQFIDSAFFGAALLCAGRPIWRSAALLGISIPLFGLAAWMHIPLLLAGMLALGCGGVLLLGWFAFGGAKLARENLRIAFSLPLVAFLAALVNTLLVRVTPVTYDAELLKLDHGVAAAIYAWTTGQTWRITTSFEIYNALPLAMILGIRFATGRTRLHLLWALCLAPLLAAPMYVILPAVGPALVSQPNAWRNCMPSLHFSWAAIVWLNASPRWWKSASFVFMVLTAFVTLGTGEHYWPDLAVAVPFTVLVQWLSEPGGARTIA